MTNKDCVTKPTVVCKLPSISPRVLMSIAKNLLILEALSLPCSLQLTSHGDE
jgi:hypothetical protein